MPDLSDLSRHVSQVSVFGVWCMALLFSESSGLVTAEKVLSAHGSLDHGCEEFEEYAEWLLEIDWTSWTLSKSTEAGSCKGEMLYCADQL